METEQHMRMKLACGVAFAALMIPAAAFAQSTGTIDAETKDVVVTGTRTTDVGGIQAPDTSKTRQVLTDRLIQRQTPGQSIDETINLIPGVSFQNNDPYGSSGGTLTIRGFDASRISQTFDGIPLNDTGNYAIYSNQQLDPELINQVTVNLGTTDIDSPTASATGSTVNYTMRLPTDDFHVRAEGSAGEYNMFRMFGSVDTGIFTPFGTKALVAASHEENENPFNHASRTDKYQFNSRIYQPLGSNGDFISLAGQYNRNRNSNFSSIPLRTDTTVITPVKGNTITTAPRVVGSTSSNRFPLSRDEREYDLGSCSTDAPQAGVADVPTSCGTVYDYSYNPSNTWNVRGQSRFTLADGLILTVEPSYQDTKANGGNGAVKGNEGYYSKAAAGGNPATGNLTGYIGGNPYFGGVDLNGDGDVIDSSTVSATGALTNTTQGVELYAPSHTATHRWIVLSSLLWDINPDQSFRVSYTYDHGHHRQTGEVATLHTNGFTTQYFPIDDPLLDANGNPMEKRNRLSFAVLNQIAGEYRGSFFDDRLVVDAGLTGKFFKRSLHQYCVTEAGGSGYVDCFAEDADQTAFLAANPTFTPPEHRTFHYSKVVPQAGFTYKIEGPFSLFGNYSKNIQVPGTDNLYNSFGFAEGTDAAKPNPETTDNFDGGLRYKSGKVQAEIAPWYTIYKNRLASAYNPDLDVTIYRNLGTVHKYGVDGNIAYQPIKPLTLYAFGSYLKSKILDNVQTGGTDADPIYAMTAGRRESGFPTYTFGGRAEVNVGPVEFGVQAKRTGPRYTNDQNLPVTQSYTLLNADGTKANTVSYQVYGAKTPAYNVVDLDARISMGWAGMGDATYLQLNVTNLFDKLYVAGFGGNLSTTSVPYAYIGAPRAVSGTINFAF